MLYAADLVLFREIVNIVEQYKGIVLLYCLFVGHCGHDLVTFFWRYAEALCYGQ
jgi:hypothetical protein